MRTFLDTNVFLYVFLDQDAANRVYMERLDGTNGKERRRWFQE